MSSARMHVVDPERSEPKLEKALVVRFPTNVCWCEAPGLPGKTMGSSGAWCEKRQFSMKFTPTRSARETSSPGASPASAAGPSAAASTRTRAPAVISASALTACLLRLRVSTNPSTEPFGFLEQVVTYP